MSTDDRPRVLAIIPARGGSKGVPGKNLALLNDTPMIAYTINAALAASTRCRIVVSTDSDELAAVAVRWGAEVPFIRPHELADDETPSIEVVLHTVEWLAEDEAYHPDLVLLLQPTSPLRTSEDIDAAVREMDVHECDAVVSVTSVSEHPMWMRRLRGGYLEPFLDDARSAHAPRQRLEGLFVLNGAIYLGKTDVLLQERTYFTPATRAYIMPRERSIDIDTHFDLLLAELLVRHRTSAR